MIREGTEDICLVSCDKADKTVLCSDRKFNAMMGYKEKEGLVYVREKAVSVLENSEGVHFIELGRRLFEVERWWRKLAPYLKVIDFFIIHSKYLMSSVQ